MRTVVLYPVFAVLHVGIVLVALAIYRASYVSPPAITGFLTSWDISCLDIYTVDDFKAPVMLCAAFSAYHGFDNYFRAFSRYPPSLGELARLTLSLALYVDYVYVGSSLAIYWILDALVAEWRALPDFAKAGAILFFWYSLFGVRSTLFPRDRHKPLRGAWVKTMEQARLER